MLKGYKTYIGIVIALAPTVAGLFGYDMGVQFSNQFPALVSDVVVLIGSAVAIYGRAAAEIPGWIAKRRQ